MAFRIKGSHIVALAITAGIAGWMYTGEKVMGGKGAGDSQSVPIAERETERKKELFKVRYVTLRPEERTEQITVRGRTKANAIITVRSETAGIVEKRHFDKGQKVNKGDLVCVIDQGVRKLQLAQAQAQYEQAKGDLEAHSKLVKKGFTAKTRLNQMKFAFDAAKAAVAQAEQELGRTEVRANATGIVQDPIVEAGDMLTIGGTCVTLVDRSPMLFVGQVSERQIMNVRPGMKASVTLVGGELVSGKVRYISPSADPQTRTFQVEIELSSSDENIRDGLTAGAVIPLPPTTAFRVSPSWINLADNGEIGLRSIGDKDVVAFVPVKILARTKDGFWVRGPEPGMRVISLGQEYVRDGEQVIPVPDKIVNAGLDQ